MQGLKFFHINLHMIYHSKALDLDITDFEYHHDLTLSSKIIPSQTSGLLHVDINLFCVTESKKAKFEELSNNISERRCELKANEPVSEQSEGTSVDIVG